MIDHLDIPVRQPFSWTECLWYLDRDFDDCMYQVTDGRVRRAFLFQGKYSLIEISAAADNLRVKWLTGAEDPETAHFVKQYVSDWFDLGSDLAPFYRLLKAHTQVGYMADAFRGLRFVGVPDLFESLLWAVTGQQINLRFAYKIKRRLVETFGSYILFEDRRYLVFPSPERMAGVSVAELKELQLSGRKAEYILNIARVFTEGTMSKDVLLSLPDFETRVQFLLKLKGIGIWTANYVPMKSLQEKAAVPLGDAGLANALMAHGIIAEKSDLQGLKNFFARFAGWESYLSLYLWRSLAQSKQPLI